MDKLNFSSLAKIIKKGVPKSTMIDITNLLLNLITDHESVFNTKGEPYVINNYYTHQWWHQLDDIPTPIKEAAASAEIMSIATAYFENEVIPKLSPQKKIDMYSAIQKLMNNDIDIADAYKEKLLAYYDNNELSKFLSETFLYAVQKNNKKDSSPDVTVINDPAGTTTDTDPRFCFSISFAEESIIELDVTSEKGAVKVFDTNFTDCIADEFSTETKNQIMKWFVSGKNGACIVVLNDRRIDSVKPQYADLEAKIDAGVELTIEEQVRYSNLGQLIKRFDHERRIKEKAITFYLKDKLFHAYSQAGFYTYLLDFIKDILNFPYRRGISQDAEYRNIFTSFDVYKKTVPKEYFVVDLLKSDVEEALKKDPLLQLADNFVCDWGIDMANKIAVQYYVQYIGRQIIDHERSILESDEYLNSSKASIHNWLTGPH